MPDTGSSNTSIFLEAIKYLGGFLVGFVASVIKKKIENKETLFKKRTFTQRIGFSAENRDWGDIQMLYNGEPINNLYSLTVEIHNDSSKDFSNVVVEISVPFGSTIYRHLGRLYYGELTKDLSLVKEYNEYFEDVRKRYQAAKAVDPKIPDQLQDEVTFITRHRRFDVQVFKRKTKSVFTLLVESFDDVEPYLNVSILEEGINLVTYQEETKRKEIKKKWVDSLSFGFFIGLAFPIYKYSNTISVAVLLMVANVFVCYLLALGLYQLGIWIKKYFFD